ncbi:DMT family transporter [Raoultella planticola]|uniref:EamA family transporter n=1 Tax=Citrobacter freundii TaxID=546 RepID=A0A385FWE4_CITFR|nr:MULTISPECIES: DMT family transporter [Enterobacteriaceae]AXV45978.1 EamA family transporter [Citrobacter freundii]KJN50919.1 multidrug DMT transporter permease [Enterobacter asburiae]KJO22949.1 multidrug DMT transporter permease [Enterobacter hormaechei subsp. xiangfangensis]KJO79557.1 multidrug DMT transporter permease [Enterobacter hormaechei subsp. xiangfangensis]KJO93883.1 multidrug DMT transporter permease [Enterobacter hormaechei subsp. xiangfangensis]
MRVADYLRLLLLAVIWGASFLFMRIAVPQFGAINTAFLRVFFGFAGLAVILFMLKSSFDFKGKFKSSVILGVINSGLPFLMYCLAAKWLPAGYSAILNATTPLMGALVGFSCFAEKLTLRKWAGIFLGLVGIIVITTIGKASSADKQIAGVIACLIATGCYGVASFLTRSWISNKGGLDPKIVAFGSQMGASIFLMPFFLWSTSIGPTVNWQQQEAWISVIAVGVICTAFAYILYFRLIADVGPLRSLTVTFLIPPFGMLWGYTVLGEIINNGFIIGATIIGVAVWMVVSPEKTN